MTVDWETHFDVPHRPRALEAERVLVVDDDEVLRELITATLVVARFEVTTAKDGRTALALIEDRLPDLVMLDVMMPDMSGIEVCRQLRSNRRTQSLPIIMLTARTQVQYESEGLMAGADIYLPKPFSPRSLLANVQKVLAS
jgi:DNA-binding response OmpR family regulator